MRYATFLPGRIADRSPSAVEGARNRVIVRDFAQLRRFHVAAHESVRAARMEAAECHVFQQSRHLPADRRARAGRAQTAAPRRAALRCRDVTAWYRGRASARPRPVVPHLTNPLIFNCHSTMAEAAMTLADVAYCS
ncbi:hypothetical protein SBBP1_190003 [Burkholderiales bacterium]|nr:hypothetical protein SBBP1_190003 [Burkholderiales bacterium]